LPKTQAVASFYFQMFCHYWSDCVL